MRVVAPEGSLFDPVFPAALSARHLAVQRLSDVVIEALSELLPERSVAASHVSFPALVFQSVDPRSGRLTLIADILGGGGGARRGGAWRRRRSTRTARTARSCRPRSPSWSTRGASSGRSSSTGRAAAARSAGGLGLRRDYRLLSDVADGMYYVEQTRGRVRAARAARAAGRARRAARRVVRAGAEREEPLPGKGYVHLYRGDVFTLVGAGGGGFGRAE